MKDSSKKLFLTLLIASVFAFGLAACGGSSQPEATDNPSMDQPPADQPPADQQTDEHPSSEHPSSEHPTQ